MYPKNICSHMDGINEIEDTLKRQLCCLKPTNLLTECHRLDLYCFSNIKHHQIGTKVKIQMKYTCIYVTINLTSITGY